MSLYQRQVQPRLLSAVLGTRSTGAIRERVCAGLVGDVVEIGYGSGLNQAYLPAAVRQVWAVEPSPVAWRLSARRRAASTVPTILAGDDAQAMPLPDDRFDCVLSTWTWCGIPDPAAALRQVRRVLRPGGVLHFVEHGLAPDPRIARWQRRGNGINRRIAGCVLDRDVRGLLEASGLTVSTLSTYYDRDAVGPATFFYEGRATA